MDGSFEGLITNTSKTIGTFTIAFIAATGQIQANVSPLPIGPGPSWPIGGWFVGHTTVKILAIRTFPPDPTMPAEAASVGS